MTTLTARSQALVEKIDNTAKMPLLKRAQLAERLVREAAALLVELSSTVEGLRADLEAMRAPLADVLKGNRDA